MNYKEQFQQITSIIEANNLQTIFLSTISEKDFSVCITGDKIKLIMLLSYAIEQDERFKRIVLSAVASHFNDNKKDYDAFTKTLEKAKDIF